MSLSESLTDDALLVILARLDPEDIVRVGTTCSRIHALSLSNTLWRPWCQRHWLLSSPEDAGQQTWAAAYAAMMARFGRYRAIYAPMRDAWNKIERALSVAAGKGGPYRGALRPGATEEQLDELEEAVGLSLPEDLRLSYRMHNGQSLDAGTGIFGEIRFYDMRISYILLEIERLRAIATVAVNRFYLTAGFLPIAVERSSRRVMCIACTDRPKLPRGSVVHPRGLRHGGCYVYADSFLAYLRKYADDLDAGRLGTYEDGVVSRFALSPVPTATTQGVTISVSTAFVPEVSELRPDNFFAYCVRMSMDAGCDERLSCRLETRQWIIRNERGVIDTVNGPGVVGKYPVMRPGAFFEYQSNTGFDTPSGEMEGTFQMRRFSDEALFDAIVPTFRMEALPFVCGDDIVDESEE